MADFSEYGANSDSLSQWNESVRHETYMQITTEQICTHLSKKMNKLNVENFI